MSAHTSSKKTTWKDILTNPATAKNQSIARDLFSGKYKKLPATRGDCTHERTAKNPCPYWKCRHHVALDWSDGFGVQPSGALYHGPSCVLDVIEEAEALRDDRNMPSGKWLISAAEIEDLLGIAARASHEAMRHPDLLHAFYEVYRVFLCDGDEPRLNPELSDLMFDYRNDGSE